MSKVSFPSCRTDFLYLSLFDLALDSQNENQISFATPVEIKKTITLFKCLNSKFFNKRSDIDVILLIANINGDRLKAANEFFDKEDFQLSQLDDFLDKNKDLLMAKEKAEYLDMFKNISSYTFDKLYGDGYFKHYIDNPNKPAEPAAEPAAQSAAEDPAAEPPHCSHRTSA